MRMYIDTNLNLIISTKIIYLNENLISFDFFYISNSCMYT